jgi:hypothetical protein
MVSFTIPSAPNPHPASYTVKCLPHVLSLDRPNNISCTRVRSVSVRSPPLTVSIHRIVEDKDFTYLFMDYHRDGDVFTHRRRVQRGIQSRQRLSHEPRYVDWCIVSDFLRLTHCFRMLWWIIPPRFPHHAQMREGGIRHRIRAYGGVSTPHRFRRFLRSNY